MKSLAASASAVILVLLQSLMITSVAGLEGILKTVVHSFLDKVAKEKDGGFFQSHAGAEALLLSNTPEWRGKIKAKEQTTPAVIPNLGFAFVNHGKKMVVDFFDNFTQEGFDEFFSKLIASFTGLKRLQDEKDAFFVKHGTDKKSFMANLDNSLREMATILKPSAGNELFSKSKGLLKKAGIDIDTM